MIKQILILLLTLFLSCSTSSLTGGALEDGNAESVTGDALTTDGTPVVNALIYAIPNTFNPFTDVLADSLSMVTNDSGSFTFAKLPIGEFRFYCTDSSGEFCSITPTTTVEESTSTITIEQLVETGGLFLAKPSQYPDSMNLYLEGTTFSIKINKDMQVWEFINIPAGIYNLMESRGGETKKLFEPFEVPSGPSIVINEWYIEAETL